MIGETNINGGGGLNGKGALLKIKSQTGSTITVSKGSYSKIIKASQLDSDDNYWSYWFFQTTDFGEWTVTATLDTDSATATMTIDSNKQYDVELTYELYLIKDGVLKTPFTLSGMYQRNGAGWVEFYTTGGAYQKVYAQLTDEFLAGGQYTKLIVEVLAFNYYGTFGIAVSGTDTNYEAEVRTPLTGATYPDTLEIDISNVILSGKYFKISWNSYPRTVRLKNVYLKR